jgi:hypothetical protein
MSGSAVSQRAGPADFRLMSGFAVLRRVCPADFPARVDGRRDHPSGQNPQAWRRPYQTAQKNRLFHFFRAHQLFRRPCNTSLYLPIISNKSAQIKKTGASGPVSFKM